VPTHGKQFKMGELVIQVFIKVFQLAPNKSKTIVAMQSVPLLWVHHKKKINNAIKCNE